MAQLDLDKVPEHKGGEPTLTPYGVWKLVRDELKRRNLPEVPSQMVYSYVSSRLIPAVKVKDSEGTWQVRVTRSAADKWVKKYCDRKAEKAAESAQA